MGRLVVFLCYLFLAALISSVAVALWGYAEYTRPGPLQVPRVVVIPKGQGLEAIADSLALAGVIEYALVFVAGARISGSARALKAGEYRFQDRVSPRDVVAVLVSGETVTRRLTLAEGLTVSQILQKLAVSDGLSGAVEAIPEEGSLLPETYHFSFGEERLAVLARMQKAMTDTLAKQWAAGQRGLPYATPREALIMASMIQREAGSEEEMPLIAGVFVNRLRRGMRLQSDPTVAYGIAPEGLNRPLTKADLKHQSPYNTYRVKGLPPGPICNPGQAAIHAAFNPVATEFLYFVVDGSGHHAFAKTLQQHNRNVAQWRRTRQDKIRAGQP